MKKLLILSFILVNIVGFSRVVNRCEIISKELSNDGDRKITCISKETGKKFQFENLNYELFSYLYTGYTYKIVFTGEGDRNLNILRIEEIY